MRTQKLNKLGTQADRFRHPPSIESRQSISRTDEIIKAGDSAQGGGGRSNLRRPSRPCALSEGGSRAVAAARRRRRLWRQHSLRTADASGGDEGGRPSARVESGGDWRERARVGVVTCRVVARRGGRARDRRRPQLAAGRRRTSQGWVKEVSRPRSRSPFFIPGSHQRFDKTERAFDSDARPSYRRPSDARSARAAHTGAGRQRL